MAAPFTCTSQKGYDSLSKFTTEAWPELSKKVGQRMGGGSSLKEPQIILYPSVDQLCESNAGSAAPGQVTLPTIIRKGNRLLVPFTGSYQRLEDDLRIATARAVWQSWFNSSVGDQVAALVQQREIPRWFSEGAIRYFALGWQYKDEEKLTTLLMAESHKTVAQKNRPCTVQAFAITWRNDTIRRHRSNYSSRCAKRNHWQEPHAWSPNDCYLMSTVRVPVSTGGGMSTHSHRLRNYLNCRHCRKER